MASPDQIKEITKLLREVTSNQKESIAPMVEENYDSIQEVFEELNSINETLDVYFWTLVRASLDGKLEPNDEESYRQTLVNDLISLQHEYLAVKSLASFLNSI